MDRRDLKDRLGLTDLGENGATREPKVRRDRRAIWDHKGRKGHRALRAHRGRRDLRDRRGQ